MNSRLKYILILGFLLRCSIFFITDLTNTEYYEYGEIAKNILAGKGYSLFYASDNQLNYKFMESGNPQPSAYMPPAYTYFLLPFFLIKNPAYCAALIIGAQIIISSITIFLMYRYTLNIFEEKTALLAAFITAINPEFIYVVKVMSPTVVFHFLILLFFILLRRYFEKTGTFPMTLIIGIVLSLLILLRSETMLIAVFIWGYFIYRKAYRHLLSFAAIVMLFISPWIIRNYVIFDGQLIMSTNLGINLYR